MFPFKNHTKKNEIRIQFTEYGHMSKKKGQIVTNKQFSGSTVLGRGVNWTSHLSFWSLVH